MPFILFSLATIGMTLILVHGTIFEGVRAFIAAEANRIQRRWEKKDLPPRFSLFVVTNKMLTCIQCTGFWCGLFCGLFLVTHESVWISWSNLHSHILLNRVLMLFCCGAAGSFLAPLGNALCDWIFFAKEGLIQKLTQNQQSHHEEMSAQESEIPNDNARTEAEPVSSQ